jgi:hypothetical protein
MSSAKVSSPYEIDSRFSEIYVLGSHHIPTIAAVNSSLPSGNTPTALESSSDLTNRNVLI